MRRTRIIERRNRFSQKTEESVAMLKSRIVAIGVMPWIVGASNVALSQPYPAKPIRMVTGEPGGMGDFTARSLAQLMTNALGQQVIVENRGSAGGVAAGAMVARALPDGYTLLSYGSAIWNAPLLQDGVPYDPVRDFAPITIAVSTPNMVVVHPSLAVKSISELIAVAKARPGQFSYASGITGASSHLAAELFNAMAKVDIVRIPYKGNGPALTAISAGEVQVSFANAAAALPHVRAARLRALAVTSAQPSALVPELPTVAASGLPDYVSVSIIGVFAPAKTPSALVALLNREIVRGLRKAETKDRLFAAGAEVVASSPDEFAFAIKSEMIKLGAIAKKIRIVAD